jgi:hypothetical protein
LRLASKLSTLSNWLLRLLMVLVYFSRGKIMSLTCGLCKGFT